MTNDTHHDAHVTMPEPAKHAAGARGRFTRWAVAVALPALGLLAVAAVRSPGHARAAEPAARHLPPPEHVTSETLRDLKGRMGRHGNGMSNLVGAVVLLDRPAIARLARNIADEEIVAATTMAADAGPRAPKAAGKPEAKLGGKAEGKPEGKPEGKADDKSRPALALPRGFFAEQDALRVAAQRLALAAAGTDDKALADAFATVTRTCVACHSSYLHGDIEPLPASGGPQKP